jgi:hypothetical protein
VSLSLVATNPRPDTDKIESFLMSLEGIVDASVWLRGGSVLATVTLCEGVHADAHELQELCGAHLGEANRPHVVLLQQALRPSA